MNRRHFLRSTALGAGAAVTLSGCGAKEEALIPLLVPEDRIIPGVDKWTASTCPFCSAGCGTLVRSMAGEVTVLRDGEEMRQLVVQAKKVEGNPGSPINHGRLCVRGQAAPQAAYHPDRIRTPMRLAGPRGSGKYRSVSWDEASALLKEKLAPAGAGLAAICGPVSRARRQLVQEFLSSAGSARCYLEEPPGIPALRAANRRMFGRPEPEQHDIENARYLVSFGASILDAHTSPVRYSLGLTHMRSGRPGVRGKFVQVESRFSLTAANADEWLPVRPGTEAMLALAMANVILAEELFDKALVASQIRNFDAYRSWVMAGYAPERVAAFTDVPVKRIARVAREFARYRPAMALAGGTALAHEQGLFTALAVQSLNALSGGIGKPGGVFWKATRSEEAPSVSASRSWAAEFSASADSISALLLLDSDPIYSMPAALGLRQKIERIPFVAAFGTVLNDSASLADLVLPDRTSLERWDVSEPEITTGSRVFSITQPIIRPLNESRDSADILLSLAGAVCAKGRSALSESDFRHYLLNHLPRVEARHGNTAPEEPEDIWERLLKEGVWVDPTPRAAAPVADLASVKHAEALTGTVTDLPEYPFYLQPFASAGLGMGHEADLPWMQELPDPMSSVVWGSWVEMNPATARKLGIRDGEWVWLESPVGKLKVPALLQPSARPDTLSMPFGQGHGTYGRYAGGRGANAWHILMPTEVHDAGEIAWAGTRVRVAPAGEKAPLIRLGYDRERTQAEVRR